LVSQSRRGRRPFLARRLEDSFELRRRVEAARTLGISLKRFEGWEPTTVHEHDEAGRLVSSTPEPEWDDAQQGWMLALAVYEDGLCPLCGRPRRICSDPDGEGKWRALLPIRCHATTALSIAKKPYLEQPQSEALLFVAERKG
jgi:hypothetical protein